MVKTLSKNVSVYLIDKLLKNYNFNSRILPYKRTNKNLEKNFFYLQISLNKRMRSTNIIKNIYGVYWVIYCPINHGIIRFLYTLLLNSIHYKNKIQYYSYK